ncbi:ATP-binding protein [Ekhidna sp.]
MAASALIYIFVDAKRDQLNDLKYTAKVIKSYYELSFHQWDLSLISVGNRLYEIENDSLRLAFANDALKVYEKELLAFGFADTSGQVITFTGRLVNDTLPNLSQSERTKRSFELTIKNNKLTLGESYYFENVSDWILPIRVPIHNSQGDIVAVNTSAVDYSTMISELEKFGFSDEYDIHLVNNEFNTTQLYFPLDKSLYASVLGSDSLTYLDIDTLSKTQDIYLLTGADPITGDDDFIACINIATVDHRLMVSIDQSILLFLVVDRFKYVLVIYILLVVASILLYQYVKRNQKRSILTLRTERANLKSIIESTSNIIGLFNDQKILIEFNKAFSISTKMTDDIDLYRGIDILNAMKHPEQSKIFTGFIERALAGEKFREEIVYPGPKGEIVFRFTYNPVYDEDKVVGLSLFAEDITEIRSYQAQLETYSKDLEKKVQERTQELESKNIQLELGYKKLQTTQQQLIRAEKMASLGILSAGIGHEINNPLNFIKHGAISLRDALKKQNEGVSYDEYFYAIEEGVRRASKIVSGLSHFSRTGEAMDESCEINQILENSLTLLASRFKSKNIEIIKSYEAKHTHVQGNEGKLHQVFTNIINNAEQAIEEKGQIKIATKDDGDNIIIEIADSGSGMNKTTLSKITDPFFTTKDPGEGTGLGLFICQMILDEHQAEMEITSKKNVGTTFTLSFHVGDKS